jgi:uncharacterized protein YcbX
MSTSGTAKTVERIRITPVKATALRSVDEVRLEPFGVMENRRFYFVDDALEQVSGPKNGPLARVRSSWDPSTEVLRLELPDGSVAEDVADRALDRQLVTDFYGRPVRGHIVDGPFADTVGAWYGRSLRLARTDEPGAANDVESLSLMSTASAGALASASGSSRPLETRRFRMLFELGGCEPFEEDTWEGRLLRLGSDGAVIRVGGQIPRCAVTTFDPDTGVRDFGTLHAIKEVRGVNADGNLPFGVYGEVVEPGTVRVGDRAILPDRDEPHAPPGGPVPL